MTSEEANSANDSTNPTVRPDNNTMAQNDQAPAPDRKQSARRGVVGRSMIGLFIGTRLLRSVLS